MATIRGAFIYRIFTPGPGPTPPPPPPPGQDERIVDIPLNIGINVLDIWYDGCYILVCTDLGVECLNSRTFDSIWYFSTATVQTICSNQEIVCFGTVSSGIYYNDFPTSTGTLGDFLSTCYVVSGTVSNNITDIYTTISGFFVGGDNGVDVLTGSGTNLEVSYQLVCSGTNSVAYSTSTDTYYWSTAVTAYSAYFDLIIKNSIIPMPGYNINSINVEYIGVSDVLYVNTASGIVRVFSSTCSGTIGDENIIDSDYVSGDCGLETIWEGVGDKVIEANIANGTYDELVLSGTVSCLLYYRF